MPGASPDGGQAFSRRFPMLVLSRKHLEKVVIDVPPSATVTKIVVQVVDIQAGKIRLGIEAPREVPVWRQEIYDAIQETAVRR